MKRVPWISGLLAAAVLLTASNTVGGQAPAATATPKLVQACTSGEPLREAVLAIRDRSGTESAVDRRIVLKNVRLSDCPPAAQSQPTETMSLNYTRLNHDLRAGAASAGYLKLGDIRGDATDHRFRDWIALESVAVDRAAGGRRTNVAVRLTKRVDRSSAALRAAHSRQTRFVEATLAVRDDRAPSGFLTIKMEEVLVSSYQTGADIDGVTLQAVMEVSGP